MAASSKPYPEGGEMIFALLSEPSSLTCIWTTTVLRVMLAERAAAGKNLFRSKSMIGSGGRSLRSANM